jgi:hypothetical protein
MKKFFSVAQTCLVSAATLYFVKSDESKQAVMKAIVGAHDWHVEFDNKDLTKLSLKVLTEELNDLDLIEKALVKSLDLADKGEGNFDTMNDVERSLAWGASTTQLVFIRRCMNKILDELKSRY